MSEWLKMTRQSDNLPTNFKPLPGLCLIKLSNDVLCNITDQQCMLRCRQALKKIETFHQQNHPTVPEVVRSVPPTRLESGQRWADIWYAECSVVDHVPKEWVTPLPRVRYHPGAHWWGWHPPTTWWQSQADCCLAQGTWALTLLF